MDLDFYRRREEEELASAANTLDAARRTGHLELAERYRAVIDAYEVVARVQGPVPGAA